MVDLLRLGRNGGKKHLGFEEPPISGRTSAHYTDLLLSHTQKNEEI